MTTRAGSGPSRALATTAPRTTHLAFARRLAGPGGDGEVVALVPADPSVHVWPALVRLGQALRALGASAGLGPVALYPAPGADPLQLALPASSGLVVTWLPAEDGLYDSAALLAASVADSRGRYAQVLIDFTGYLPDLPEMLHLPDRIVTVARAGHTHERALEEHVARLPPERHAGVLLVG